MRARLVLALVLVSATSGGAQEAAGEGPATKQPARKAEIAKLIRDLGNDRYRVREAAHKRLREIGLPAAGALREALKSPDLEVKARARILLDAIFLIAPERLAKERSRVQAAVRKADYPAAIRFSREITAKENAEMLDWLWFAHVCQLGGQWADAAKAYRKVAGFIDRDIREGVRKPAGDKRAPVGGKRAGVALRRVGPVGPVPFSARERKGLINQRSMLMLWIARIQRAELKDPRSAAETVAKALKYLEASKTEVDYVWLTLAKEYPLLRHDAGDVKGALQAWKQSVATRKRSKHRFSNTPLVDVERIHAALAALPQGAARPDVPWLVSLSPDKPETKLVLSDPRMAARAYHPGRYSRYAFAPPQGKEFAAIEFACDIEQVKLRTGGHFQCSVMADDPPGKPKEIGSIGWPYPKLARRVVYSTFLIPPGAGLAHIRVGSHKGWFTVHSVSAKATFRPITRRAPPVQADAWMQTELHPPTGRLTWGERELRNEAAYSGVRPRRETLRFSVPGRPDAVRTQFQVRPGRRYGLFVNLRSPFQWTQLRLELAGRRHGNPPRLSIQRHPGGGYVAIWCSAGGKLLAAQSKDLIDWTRPEPLPFSSVFDNIEPATFRAADGSIYLAFFSNRLSPLTSSTAGYHLWLTRTRDGRTWAPIRRIEIGRLGGWPPSAPSMCAGPDGKHWLFWRDLAGSTRKLDDLAGLTPIRVPNVNRGRPRLWNVSVTCDGRKRFHMVCDDFGQAVYHLTSADGRGWNPVRVLVRKAERVSRPTSPQLILAGEKILLLHAGAYLLPVAAKGGPVPAGTGIKVTNHVVPLAGARIFRERDEVFLLAGTQTTWLLRAKLKDLLAAAEKPAPAEKPVPVRRDP